MFTHAAVGFAAAKVATEDSLPNTKFLLASMTLSVLPDADALFIGIIPYNHPFGHRGFTHSLVFAALAGVVAALVFSKAGWAVHHSVLLLAVLFALVTASHGFFDAMTDGGLGIAFFAPFTNHRYFLPWRPIPVAPLSLAGLMTPEALQVFRAEAALFWIFTLGAAIWNRKTAWRKAVAGLCAVVGTVLWILALKESS